MPHFPFTPGPASRDKTSQVSLLRSGGAPGFSAKFILRTRIPLRKVTDSESITINPAGFLALRGAGPRFNSPVGPRRIKDPSLSHIIAGKR